MTMTGKPATTKQIQAIRSSQYSHNIPSGITRQIEGIVRKYEYSTKNASRIIAELKDDHMDRRRKMQRIMKILDEVSPGWRDEAN